MNIGFSKLGRLGRLGNCLWQIASTAGIALKNGMYCNFPEWQYDKYFISSLPPQKEKGIVIKEKQFAYSEYKLFPGEYYDLDGYFQSYKYFEHCKGTIKEQFTFKAEFVEEVKNKFRWSDEKKKIAIHVRRGDYVNNQAHFNLSMKYYIRAIEKIPNWQECQIIVFSDDQQFCEWHLQCLPNVCFSYLNEIEDLCLMTLCNHFIIANSSFSWWGAYLGEKKGSIIVRPENHFSGTLLRHDIKDLYPPHWLTAGEEPVNLENTTFIIPTHYDHPDRMSNLTIAINHLLKYFKTNIHIIEQGGGDFSNFGSIVKYSQVNHVHFHRTKMINDAAKEAKTEFVVNYDADVLINPVQTWYSVLLLKEGKQIVYPYSGRFIHIPKVFHNFITENYYPLIKSNFRENAMSWGGAVFMNRKSFLSAGGENEKFISFGPEDAERYNRFLKLGLKVCRVRGPIYHLDHFRGLNSRKTHQFIESNRAEWRKIEAMTEKEVQEYVKTWPVNK